MSEWVIWVLESVQEVLEVEEIQRIVWSGSETDVIPGHMILAAVHNGGIALGAYPNTPEKRSLIGFVFGFPGIYTTPAGPRVKHHSHILAVHPDWRGKGMGFSLKQAQWQLVREQGLDRVTWTFDPMLSRNAHLNIARLGAVCNVYLRSEYGKMRDHMNSGLPSDRFMLDWWVHSKRVENRLGGRSRPDLSLDLIRKAGACELSGSRNKNITYPPEGQYLLTGPIVLVEIPLDFLALKDQYPGVARDWRFYTRDVFETAFESGYVVTDFVRDAGRCYYVLTLGDKALIPD